MDAISSDIEKGVADEQNYVWDPIEEVQDVLMPDIVPPNAVNSELKQQLNQVNICLAPVPEHELLLHVDSHVHQGSGQIAVEDFSGTMSGSGNNSGSDAGEYLLLQSCLFSM